MTLTSSPSRGVKRPWSDEDESDIEPAFKKAEIPYPDELLDDVIQNLC